MGLKRSNCVHFNLGSLSIVVLAALFLHLVVL